MDATSASSGVTRERLLDSAEELFAEHGVDRVSLRQIGRHAGQHNTSTMQYHFDTREALLRALFDRHIAVIDRRHHAYLDRFVDQPPTVARLVEALVRPIAEQLNTTSGRRFVEIRAQRLQRESPEQIGAIDPTERSGFDRWRLAVESVLDDAALNGHIRFTAVQFTYTELANWSRRDGDRLDIERVTHHVMRLVAALLVASVSVAVDITQPTSSDQARSRASARNLSTR